MKSSRAKTQRLLQVAKAGLLGAFLFSLSSCAHVNTREISAGLSDSKISHMHSFYVRRHADDDYKLDEDITAELREMGYRVTSGSAETPPAKVDAVITYTDHWMWDITMYMLSLEVQLREPGSDFTLANAKTVRTSLVRKSQKAMVHETLTKLLKNS